MAKLSNAIECHHSCYCLQMFPEMTIPMWHGSRLGKWSRQKLHESFTNALVFMVTQIQSLKPMQYAFFASVIIILFVVLLFKRILKVKNRSLDIIWYGYIVSYIILKLPFSRMIQIDHDSCGRLIRSRCLRAFRSSSLHILKRKDSCKEYSLIDIRLATLQ